MKDLDILVNHKESKVITLDSGLIQLIDNNFKYKDPNIAYSQKCRELIAKKLMDEYKHLFSVKKQTLPIGFLEELCILVRKHGYNPVIEDLREYPEFNVPKDYNDILKASSDKDTPTKFRYYQEECFDAIFKGKKFNGVIEGATAFGKTLVFLALTRMINCRILIIFPGVDLVFQTKEKAEELGFTDVGLISGQHALLNKRVMLTNYQSLEKLDNPKIYKAVFVDEMHSAKASTLYNFLKKVPAAIRLGFSATPYVPFKAKALDNALNKAHFGEKIYVKKAKELMNEGYLAETQINFIRIREPYGLTDLDHMEAIDKGIVNNKLRNQTIKELATKDNKITLIILERREHGEILKEMIPNSEYVNGDTEKDDRAIMANLLNTGKVRVVVSSRIWSTGIDIPNLEQIIVAGSGKSFYRTIQIVGRGLRKPEGKEKLTVWDFIDDTNKYLYRWSKMRWTIYKTEKFDIKSVKIDEILKENKVK
jgi:superfamily II DNA or RNA helicase